MITLKKYEVLKKILNHLEEEEGAAKRIANFMFDYSKYGNEFGEHSRNPVFNDRGEEMGDTWIGRTYGFGIKDRNVHRIINEYLFMQQEIERLEKEIKKLSPNLV